MQTLISQIQTYQSDTNLINKLVDKEIEYRIQKGIYEPKDQWSPGSEPMIRSFIECSLNHTFKQSIKLLQDIEEVSK